MYEINGIKFIISTSPGIFKSRVKIQSPELQEVVKQIGKISQGDGEGRGLDFPGGPGAMMSSSSVSE